MRNNWSVRCCVLAAASLVAGAAMAQLGKPREDELMRRGNGPGPVAGAGANTRTQAPDAAPATAGDPRDFAGYWRGGGGGGPGGALGGARTGGAGGPGGGGGQGGAAGAGPGGAPGGAPGGIPGAAPGGAPGGTPGAAGFGGAGGPGGAGGAGGGAGGGGPGGPGGAVAGRLSDRILCMPQSGTQVGVDGPLLLTQTPEQITWASEEMHTIRRIYLTGDYTKNFKQNYYGEAIGHWEGNTLVIETAGMKSLAPGAKMVERWTKSADGKTIEMKSGNVDATGKALGTMRTSTLSYRTGEQVYEWMCEDYNDEWLPGGTDYEDQVGDKPNQNEQVKK